jgi:hypothetical protein
MHLVPPDKCRDSASIRRQSLSSKSSSIHHSCIKLPPGGVGSQCWKCSYIFLYKRLLCLGQDFSLLTVAYSGYELPKFVDRFLSWPHCSRCFSYHNNVTIYHLMLCYLLGDNMWLRIMYSWKPVFVEENQSRSMYAYHHHQLHHQLFTFHISKSVTKSVDMEIVKKS